MRRHPLTRGIARLGGGTSLTLVLAACLGMPGASEGSPAGETSVTVRPAPGDRLAFEPAEVTVRSVGPLTLTFENVSSLAHNLVFTDGLTAATRTIVEPGTSDRLSLVTPRPGDYRFVCTIHDGMAGMLIVAPETGRAAQADDGYVQLWTSTNSTARPSEPVTSQISRPPPRPRTAHLRYRSG